MLDFFRHAPQSPRAPSETDSRHSESSNGTEVSDTAALLEVMNGSARTSIRVVGARQSGKTSLVHALKGPPPSAASSATRTPVAVGLSIHPWEFQLETDERTSTLHVAVWDYTGNDDETARLASALSTPLSLRVVCVDARALLDAASSPVLTTGDANDRDVFADFVDASVLPWVQATTPRHQQQEEITLFLTKMDLVGAADETALTAAKQKLEDRIQSRLTAAIKRTQAAPSRVPIRWLAAQLVDVKTQLEMLVVQSDKSFSLPPGYQRGLDILDEMRAANAKVRRSDRASYSFIHITKLVGIIRSKSPMLSDAAAREMLRKFHDIGDIVWFADGPEALRNVVVLDPRVLVDFVRVVVQAGKRDRNDEVMPHASLLGLMPWMALDDEHATAAIKQFMVHAQLAHTPRGETEWDSDLIVPSYWRSLDSWSTALASGPLSVSNADLKNAAPLKQVRWQYHFVGPLPQDFLELVLCESYSPLWHRAVHHNGVRFETDDDFACAVVVDQTIPDQCVVHLSAVAFAKDAPCWWIFQCAAEAIEKVLDSYGDAVLVSRSAVNDDDEPHRLETVAAYWAETSPAYRVTIAWLPPDLAWYQDIVVKRASSDGN